MRWFERAAVRVLDGLSKLCAVAAGVIICAIAVVIFIDVVARYVFDAPTSWGFSVTLFGMMWLVLLGMPLATKQEGQISVTLLVDHLSEYSRRWLSISTAGLSLIFVALLGYYGFLYTLEAYSENVLSTDLLNYPVWLLRLSIPVGAGLCCLQLMRVIWVKIDALKHHGATGIRGRYDRPWLVMVVLFAGVVAGGGLIHWKPVVGLVVLLVWFLFAGMPVAFAMGLIGAVGIFAVVNGFASLSMMPSLMEPMLSNFVMVAIPMFLFAGVILEKSGMGELIFDVAAKWVSFVPGGLAVGTVLACALLSAMSGVSMAVAAAITGTAVAALSARGYSKELIYGCIGGGALGSFIPPSIGLILYGYMTGTSVGKLFMAAIVPAAIVVAIYVSYVILRCAKGECYKPVPTTWVERWGSLKSAWLVLLIPVIVLGGIYSGIFTPTEAAGVLVVYAVVAGVILKRISWRKMREIIVESAAVASRLMIVAAGAIVLSYFITRLGVAQTLAASIATMETPRAVVLVGLVLMYVILGMFLDGMSITVITVPVLFPMLPSLGIDPYVFGVLLVMLIETAAITPPVGMNLFVIQSVTGDRLGPIVRGNIPFAVLLLLAVILVMFVPQITLWLPGLLGF